MDENKFVRNSINSIIYSNVEKKKHCASYWEYMRIILYRICDGNGKLETARKPFFPFFCVIKPLLAAFIHSETCSELFCSAFFFICKQKFNQIAHRTKNRIYVYR